MLRHLRGHAAVATGLLTHHILPVTLWLSSRLKWTNRIDYFDPFAVLRLFPQHVELFFLTVLKHSQLSLKYFLEYEEVGDLVREK